MSSTPSLPELPAAPLVPLARAAHDLGLASLVGGNLFGRLALHPSVTEIASEAERGKVVNAAWRRYGTVNALGLAGVVGGWVSLRQAGAATGPTAAAGDVLVGVVTATGVATAVAGVLFARAEPGGAVPLEDGNTAAPSATAGETRAKRRLDALGRIGLVSELALVALGAATTRPAPGRLKRIKRALPRVG